ncbi:outer membrane protein [Aestuariispira insulae]|uniref:Opacity protein-like surface antigen n=1 Tax=Aestuariispira insulae TaxID=1461337 RepID=A0A3D9HK17_9PROT|nr:outer membrane beta-barrel protein [Aestuariispira insulae]RED49804.1 opacity protein-like surface antigen [Aestuariispira insulae]
MRIVSSLAAIAIMGMPAMVLADGHGGGGNFYAGGSLGYAILDDVDFKESGSNATTKTADFDGSFAAALRGGYDYGDIRAELEIGYRSFDVDSVSTGTNPSGDADFYSVMVNGAYDFDTGTAYTPYVMLGLGVGIVEGNISYTSSDGSTVEDKNFYGVAPAGQIGLGVAYEMNEDVDVVGGYSLLMAPQDETGEDDTIMMHSLMIGLNYNF